MSEIDALADFRARKDEFFRLDMGSPLPRPDRSSFQGLTYYDANPELIFEIRPTAFETRDEVLLETSDGRERAYERLGLLEFEVEGVPAALTVFRDPDTGHLFLPFRDRTSGRETYGAGRYLEVPVIEEDDDGEPLLVYLDFNYAYHPYCAYNSFFSCPLPPGENWLTVPIRAGERNL